MQMSVHMGEHLFLTCRPSSYPVVKTEAKLKSLLLLNVQHGQQTFNKMGSVNKASGIVSHSSSLKSLGNMAVGIIRIRERLLHVLSPTSLL